MRASITAPVVLATIVAIIAMAPSFVAVDPVVEAKGKLFFDATTPDAKGSLLGGACGEQPLYTLTTNSTPDQKAYLARSVLEALSCATDFDFEVTRGFTVTGRVEVYFPLLCERIGVIQSSGSLLDSVTVSILKNNAEIAKGEHVVSTAHVAICGTTTTFNVGVVTSDVADKGVFEIDDVLTARVLLKAANTEPDLLPYWYLRTGADANMTATGLNPPAPSGGTTPPPPTTTSGTGPTPTSSSPGPTSSGSPSPSPSVSPSPSPSSSAPPQNTGPAPPHCARDNPKDFQQTRAANQSFTLRARCTDANDDMESGDWRINDTFVERDPLERSPDTADHTFRIEEPGTYDIHFVPKDEAGHVGTSASWRVTVTDGASPEATHVPFFPSATGLALGLFGALGGALLVLRRRK